MILLCLQILLVSSIIDKKCLIATLRIEENYQNIQSARDGKASIEFNMKVPNGAVLLHKNL